MTPILQPRLGRCINAKSRKPDFFASYHGLGIIFAACKADKIGG